MGCIYFDLIHEQLENKSYPALRGGNRRSNLGPEIAAHVVLAKTLQVVLKMFLLVFVKTIRIIKLTAAGNSIVEACWSLYRLKLPN